MTVMALSVDAKPVCMDPQYLAVVDAAFETPGGPDSHWMRERLCTRCPERLACLLTGNATGEHGVWGGLIGKERVQAGGKSTYTTVGSGSFANLQGIDHGVRRPGKAA